MISAVAADGKFGSRDLQDLRPGPFRVAQSLGRRILCAHSNRAFSRDWLQQAARLVAHHQRIIWVKLQRSGS
jgi:hypothetical protein